MLQVINHLITVEELRHPEQKKTACYDIDVEVDDTLKTQMNSFLLSTASQQVIPFSNVYYVPDVIFKTLYRSIN